MSIEKVELATARATLMYGCYRRDDAADVVIFLDAAAAILADYPDDVIMRVTDPRTGLPGRIKWPPQPQEVKEACEEIMQPRRWLAEWNRRTALQLAERTREDEERARRPAGLVAGRSVRADQAPPVIDDGRHFDRIAADLATRRERNQAAAP